MNIKSIQCQFEDTKDVCEAEELVQLAIIAASGLYSEAKLRLGTRYCSNELLGSIQIDIGSPAGESVGHIFLALADRAFEPERYKLRVLRGENHTNKDKPARKAN